MTDVKPCCGSVVLKAISPLAFCDGQRIGLANRDTVIREVVALRLTEADTARREHLERIERHNCVAACAEGRVATALYRTYVGYVEVSGAPRQAELQPR